MPELPEVENLVRQLKSSILNRTILSSITLSPRLRRDIPKDLSKNTTHTKINTITRRAKYIIMTLSNAYSLIIHLGMTGRINIIKDVYTTQKHDHLIMRLSDDLTMVYNDPRRFGLVDLTNTNGLSEHKLFNHLGVEPLSEEFNSTYLLTKLKDKQSAIKNVIMNNEIIVGVGNIYASEALFLSHIRPDRIAGSITEKEATLLVESIKKILQQAINSGGSSIRDFVSIDNKKGGFQKLFKVYGRRGSPCLDCESIIEKITQAGRSSFFCPQCQK
jgi:formamidopyrimidine-DNA glycosylase